MPKVTTIPFTEPFIDRLADHILREYIGKDQDLTRVGVVFGGRRPALFLKRALGRRIKSAWRPPAILTIDDLMGRLTQDLRHRGMSDLDHCFLMWELAKQHAPEILGSRPQFVQFLPWAREVLKFIEQLDLEAVPESALESFSQHAAIGFNLPGDINSLLQALMHLRRHYHRYLTDHRRSCRGFEYLTASRLAAGGVLPEFDRILFCNFFYLHRTEEAVIKALVEAGKAELIVQGDQRRWPALKRISALVSEDVVEGKTVVPTAFDLKLYAAFDMHAQAGLVGEILKTAEELEDTVIVLPNPDSMLPLLSTIGPQLEQFNISLGYPLKRSSLYGLLEAIVAAHKSMKAGRYYARDYLRVLRHPFAQGLDFECPAGTFNVLVHSLQEFLTGQRRGAISGQIFLQLEDILKDDAVFESALESLAARGITSDLGGLKSLLSTVHRHLFAQWQEVGCFFDLAGVLRGFCETLSSHSRMGVYPLNGRMAVRLVEIAREWEAADFGRRPLERLDLLRLMQERLERELVAFSGSPLRGLQILGLLETRSLSFKNVIILDVNEGVLPNLNMYEPLIPREVMISLNLDRLELEEEIQRYQFMRLISSARNVHLIYLDRPDGERSRFIEELIWEREQRQGRKDAVPIERPAFRVALNDSRRQAQKTPGMVEFLRQFKFSATSLNAYVRNPYEFYLNYVLGLRQKDDLLDEPEDRQIGIFVHGLLEESFRPWIGRKPVLDAAFSRAFWKRFEERFHDGFGRGLKSDAFLIEAVLRHRLLMFLEVEAARVQEEVGEVLFIERRFEDVIELPCGPVRLLYRVDRVDSLNDGTILILDYKTGSLNAPAQDPSFQMPLYLHYLEKHYPGRSADAALYSLRNAQLQRYLNPKLRQSRDELRGEFLAALQQIMAEIFNPKIPFVERRPEVQ